MRILCARWVLPVDGPPIERGAVAMDRGRIVQVGRLKDLPAGPHEDLGDQLLLPGFVNAHSHLELSCYRGRVAPGPLWDWLLHLVTLHRQPGAADAERRAARQGAVESLAAGVTCVGDISRTGLHVEALASVPLRKVCFLELFSGSSQAPNDAATLAAAARAALARAEPDRLMIGLSPHALYSVTGQDLAATARLAAELALPVTIHVLETPDERRWLRDGGGPLGGFLARWTLPTADQAPAGSALERLEQSGLLALGPLLAHVNDIDDDDLGRLARSSASVVWCPRAHRFFGHGRHRWREMLGAGVNVCAGTDSLASNSSLSILDELRFLRAAEPDAPPVLLLEMGTSRAARGLGLGDRLGSLRPGLCADLVAVPLDAAGPGQPLANLLDGSASPSAVWVAGERVFSQAVDNSRPEQAAPPSRSPTG